MMPCSVRTVRCVTLCAVTIALALAPSVATCEAEEIAIEVAPRTLNLQSEGVVVTVHTDLPYGAVQVSTVYLNGIAIDSWKADNQGNFVAKFLMSEVKLLDGLVIGDYNTLKIVGLTRDDAPFWGQQDVMVIDVAAKGREPSR